MAVSLRQLAEAVDGRLVGDGEIRIDRVASLQSAVEGCITFLSDPRLKKQLETTRASAVILRPELSELCPTAAVLVDNPYLAYARVAALLNPEPEAAAGIHPSAVVDPEAVVDPSASIGPLCVVEAGARIGPRAVLGPGCQVGRGVSIGEDSRLVARVTVCAGSVIGRRALIHPGAVIGSAGFGLADDSGRWVRIPQVGRAVLGDDVEVGANTTIDRGALDDTVIEDGVKLDNLIQVGHNVRIGAHSAVAGAVGIAGSAKIGRHCMIGGGAGIAGHLEIADNVVITGRSVVTRSISEPGVYSSTLTVQPQQTWNRNLARLTRLDELAQRVRAIEKRQNNPTDTGE